MRTLVQAAILGGLSMVAAHSAQAQYYYAPPPPPPGYYEPPPRYYRPPPREIGYRCDAFLPTQYGPRRDICPIIDPKPLGMVCHCPSPSGYGPDLRGRVIP